MSMKRSSIIVMLLLCLSLSGCTPDSPHPASGSVETDHEKVPDSEERVELELALAAYEPEVPGWSAVIEAANKKLESRNIFIKVNKIPTSTWDPYYQKILTLIAAGSAPDIGRIAESYMPILIRKNLVVELTDKIGDIDQTEYVDSAFTGAAHTGGKSYGLPCGIYTMLLYYNRDLFDEAGLPYPSGDWNHPMTWSQFREDASRLTKGDGAEKIFGAHLNLGLLMVNQYLLNNNGSILFDNNGTCTLDNAKNTELFDLFGTMFTKDKSLMRPVDAKKVGYQDMFRAGRIAIMVEGTWFLPAARKITLFRPGIAAIPSNSGKSLTTDFIDSWVIYKGSKHEKEAWEALKAIISKESFDALAPYGVGGIPVTVSTVDRMKDQMIGSPFNTDDQKTFIDSIQHTVGASYSVSINELAQEWDYALEQFSSGALTTREFISRETEALNKGQSDRPTE